MLDPSAATLLDVSHVSQTFAKGSGEAGPPVLKDVSLTLRTGEIVALLGRSGCGKSSLLRIISGLTRPTEGTVKLDGNPVDGPAEGVADGVALLFGEREQQVLGGDVLVLEVVCLLGGAVEDLL